MRRPIVDLNSGKNIQLCNVAIQFLYIFKTATTVKQVPKFRIEFLR